MAKRVLKAEYIIRDIDYDIHCTLYRKACKNLRIAVDANQEVKITAPLRASDSYISEVVKEKTGWIIKTILKLQNRQILPLPCEYISDEKTTYLGKEYNLNVVTGKKANVTLLDGELVVQVKNSDADTVKRLVDKWYRVQAEKVFWEYLDKGLDVMSDHGLRTPMLKIRNMKNRWGSCTRSGIITLNLRLIYLPEVCIEYIIMHELCHLRYLNHSRYFYMFLQSTMPDWKERKIKLESYRLMNQP
jgi:predicted metal-dependent hydrolase